MLIVCLLAIGAVYGDVSHLQGGSNGYDYPVPSVKFPEPENNYLPRKYLFYLVSVYSPVMLIF